MLTAILLLLLGIVSLVNLIWTMYDGHNFITGSSDFVGFVYMIYGMIFFILLIYHVRFSRIELVEVTKDKRDFIADLESAAVPVKLFYLLMALRWKINEYFGLV
jgi:hypothetical protein